MAVGFYTQLKIIISEKLKWKGNYIKIVVPFSFEKLVLSRKSPDLQHLKQDSFYIIYFQK